MEFSDFLYALLALIFVLGLIGALALAARRFGLGYQTPSRKGKQRRLFIVEAIQVDTKRRLVLLRRDTTEHLVLLGAASELLVESGIPAPGEGVAAVLEEAAGGTGKDRS